MTEGQVIGLLGEPTSQDKNDVNRVGYHTEHGFLMGWYFLVLEYKDGKVNKISEELD